MLRRTLLLSLCLAAPFLRAEELFQPTATSGEAETPADAVVERRREARELAWKERWDEAAAAFLELAAAKGEGWEEDARDARASAGRAAAARGETDTARTALEAVLREDPANLLARSGLAALAPGPPPEPAAAPSPEPAAAPESTDPGLLYREALALGEEGRLLAARERLRRSLRADPGARAVEKSLPRLERDLLRQVEASMHRHDRPNPAPLPDERLFLGRIDRARKEGHLPEDAPLEGPFGARLLPSRFLLADAQEGLPPIEIPPPETEPEEEEAEPTEAERAADLAHGLAQAETLEKSEAFEQARAVLEALKAAHPEAAREVDRRLDALGDARLRAEDARKAREREAAEAEARRAREEAEAKEAAAEARRRQAYEAGRDAFRGGDWAAARALLEGLQQSDPGYRDVPELLAKAIRAQEKAAAEARAKALADAKAALEAGRTDEARGLLAPLDPKDADVAALTAGVLEAESRRAREEAEARAREEADLRAAAIEAALKSASAGDFKDARAQLYELKAQHPEDPRIEAAFSRLAAFEAAPPRTEVSVAPSSPPSVPPEVLRRRSERRAEARGRAEAAERDCEAGRALYFDGRLEEARERFQEAVRSDPSRREAARYLARVEREIRDRRLAGVAATPAGAVPDEDIDERCRKALGLFESGDLEQAEPALRSLSASADLGWWQRRRVGRALAEIDRRRAESRVHASEAEVQRLREIAYFVESGRADDARRALREFLETELSDEARDAAERMRSSLPPER